MTRTPVPSIIRYPDPENIRIIQELKDIGKHITDADRTRMLFFEIDVLNKLRTQILNEKSKSVRNIVKSHMDEVDRIKLAKFKAEHTDTDHCRVELFYPKMKDLTLCPCGCGYGYCFYDSTWYTPDQIKDIDIE